MCYYKMINATTGDLELHYKTRWTHKVWILKEGVQKGFDFPKWPIMTKDKGLIEGQWGILPVNVHTPEEIKSYRAKAYGGLNAKIENIDTIWGHYEQNRCLVPVTSFKEWRHEEVPGRKTPNKIPYEVVTECDIASVAGIYNDWKSPEGEIIRTYAILTTQANKIMEFVHNSKKRMPVFIKPEDEQRWLDGEPAENFAFPYSMALVSFKMPEAI